MDFKSGMPTLSPFSMFTNISEQEVQSLVLQQISQLHVKNSEVLEKLIHSLKTCVKYPKNGHKEFTEG